MDPNFHVTSATFNHKFRNFSGINKLTQSPACWIQNMPWKIFIEPVTRNNKKYMSVFVSCAASITSNVWSCRASVRSYKLDGISPKVIKSTKYLVFDSAASTSWGHDTFILWDTVLKPSNGFIKNDTITIEVIIDADEPVGLKLTTNFFTDERANAAIKLCDQTVSNLQSKIQQLTKKYEELQRNNETSTEKIKNLEKELQTSKQNCAELKEKLEEKNKENTKLQNDVDSTNKQLAERVNENENLTKILNEKNLLLSTLSENIKQLESSKTKELEKCKKENEDLQSKYTALSNDFEKFKTASSNILSENENELKSSVIALNNENTQLKENLTLLQKQLNDADESHNQTKILENEMKLMKEKEMKTEKNVDLISKKIQDSELIIDMVKNETEQDYQRKEHENAKLKSQIQSLKSQLYDTLVKLKILQDINEKTKTEYDNLVRKMQIESEKYDDLMKEKASLLEQIENLNEKVSKSNEVIENVKREIRNNEEKIKTVEDKLNETTNSYEKLQIDNQNITTQLKEANSKIKSFQENTSQDLTNLVNEKNVLTNENEALRSKVEEITNELQEFKNKKLEDEIVQLRNERTKLTTELNSAKQDLEDTKTKLSKTQNELKKFIATEKSVSLIQSQLDIYKNKLKVMEEKKLDDVISKLKAEKTRLEGLVKSLRKNPEKLIKDETVEKNIKLDNKKTQIDDPDFGIDLVKGLKDGIKVKKEEKNSNGNITEKNQEKLEMENSSENNIEVIRNQFESLLQDADKALRLERNLNNNKLDLLLKQLKREKEENDSCRETQEKLNAEISKLKEGIDVLRTLKNDFFKQLETCQSKCFDLCYILFCILKDLKIGGKLSCSLDAFIISFFSGLKNFELWKNGTKQELNGKVMMTDITPDAIEAKIEELRISYEESTTLIRKNYALEINENSKLRSANKELVVLYENEANFSKQYKKMLIMAHSRLVELRRQLSEVETKFFEEKTRRHEYEEICRRSGLLLETNELLMDDLKVKLMKHATKLSDVVQEVDSNFSTLISGVTSSGIPTQLKAESGSAKQNSSPDGATQSIDEEKIEHIVKPLEVVESSTNTLEPGISPDSGKDMDVINENSSPNSNIKTTVPENDDRI